MRSARAVRAVPGSTDADCGKGAVHVTDRDAKEMGAEVTGGMGQAGGAGTSGGATAGTEGTPGAGTTEDAALPGEDPGVGADESGLASGSLETEEGSPT